MNTVSITKPVRTLGQGLFFGLLFGFLLQKGGVAKFEVLMGVLLLKDFTVIKVILSAILVGMLGIGWLHHQGKVELKLKPTRLASNSIGGLIFGVGFALSAYCPGTGAAALGQGNFDALAVILGMLCGSYIYACFSDRIENSIGILGDKGKIRLPEVFRVPPLRFMVLMSFLIIAFLVTLEWVEGSFLP